MGLEEHPRFFERGYNIWNVICARNEAQVARFAVSDAHLSISVFV